MKDWITTDWQAILNVFISTVLIFSILIIWVRISGLSPDNSWVYSKIGCKVLYLKSLQASLLTLKSPNFEY